MASAAQLQVERVDFITIPTRDPERARAFYHETLGLPRDPRNADELTAGQVTLTFSESIEPRFSIISVTDVNGHQVTSGSPARDRLRPAASTTPSSRRSCSRTRAISPALAR